MNKLERIKQYLQDKQYLVYLDLSCEESYEVLSITKNLFVPNIYDIKLVTGLVIHTTEGEFLDHVFDICKREYVETL